MTKREITPENMAETTLITTVTFEFEKAAKNEVTAPDVFPGQRQVGKMNLMISELLEWKKDLVIRIENKRMVGERGFEPPTSAY